MEESVLTELLHIPVCAPSDLKERIVKSVCQIAVYISEKLINDNVIEMLS